MSVQSIIDEWKRFIRTFRTMKKTKRKKSHRKKRTRHKRKRT